MIDANAIKHQATGRWPEIFASVGGIDRDLLDGKHHPCPKCGGTDRFRLLDQEAGSLFCNQCFSSGNGDGLAAIQWLCDCDFPTAVAKLADYLNVSPNGRGNQKTNAKPKQTFPTAAKAVAVLESKYGKRSADWTYHKAKNEPAGLVLRWNESDGTKNIRPVSRIGSSWIIGGMPEPRPLYRLPELADTQRVYVVEGEKSVDAAWSIGLVATTSAHGCKSAKKTDWSPLAGKEKEIVILPDADAPGKAYGETVAGILSRLNPAVVVKIVHLADLPEGGDIVDWLDAGHTVDELVKLVDESPVWEPGNEPESTCETTGDGRHFPLTDTGNAERLVHLFGDRIRYCHPRKSFLVWDGRRWAIDQTGAAEQLAKKTARSILKEASEAGDQKERDQLIAFARRSESANGRAAMLRLVQSEPGVPVMPDSLDKNAFLLNVDNGTLDLRTGKLRPHDKADMLTKCAPVIYDPDAKAPALDRFVNDIFAGDNDLITFVQRFLGYSLTGDVSEQILAIWHGVGNNGKSTLVNAILEVMGLDYAFKAPSDMLLAKRGSEHPTALTDLHGKRLVACIETDEGRRLAESLAKELTGGDPIRARRMREDYWQFWPTHKVVLACNHKPVIRGTDHAMWRRIKLVPFKVVIPPEKRDRQLPEKLKAERPGILAWLVRGCLDWQKYGLGEPKAVVEATSNYACDEDTLGQFVSECCEVNEHLKVKASDLVEVYREWSGDKRMSTRRMTQMLVERGVEKYRNNGVWYSGIGVLANGPTDERTGFDL